MSWSKWRPRNGRLVAYKIEGQLYDGWHHQLISLDDSDPDNNHVHWKHRLFIDFSSRKNISKNNNGPWVWCSAVVKSRRIHSRRIMIEKINKITGLNLNYKPG